MMFSLKWSLDFRSKISLSLSLLDDVSAVSLSNVPFGGEEEEEEEEEPFSTTWSNKRSQKQQSFYWYGNKSNCGKILFPVSNSLHTNHAVATIANLPCESSFNL